MLKTYMEAMHTLAMKRMDRLYLFYAEKLRKEEKRSE